MVRGSRWLKFSWWWGSEPPGMWRAIWPGRRLYWGTGVKTAPRRWQWVGPWGRGSKIRSHSGGEHWNKRWLGVSSVLLVGIAELWSVICDNRLCVRVSAAHCHDQQNTMYSSSLWLHNFHPTPQTFSYCLASVEWAAQSLESCVLQ